jgi:hypothetical protein
MVGEGPWLSGWEMISSESHHHLHSKNMKPNNGMNDNGRLNESVLSDGKTALFRWVGSWLAAFGAVVALVALSGCASAPVQEDTDAYQYNQNTGYPAIGVGVARHL